MEHLWNEVQPNLTTSVAFIFYFKMYLLIN